MAALTEAVFALDARVGLVNLGTGGAALNPTSGSNPSAADSNDPVLLTHDGTNYVYLPGVGGNYVMVPDNDALDITGDIDIRIRCALDAWSPPTGTNRTLVGKWNTSNLSYNFTLSDVAFRPRLFWSTNGTANIFRQANAVLPFTGGNTYWLRATLDVDNGAGGHDVAFYWAPDSPAMPTSWTQLGTTITTAGTTSIFKSTSNVNIFADSNGGANRTPGKCYRAQILNGIDGPVVLDVDFTTGVTSGAALSVPVTGPSALATNSAYVENLGTLGQAAPARPGSAFGADSNDPEFLPHTGTNYLYLPGVGGNRAVTPDAAALDITGDLDVRVYLAADSWSPSGNSTLASKINGGNGQRSWHFWIQGASFLPRLFWSPDGTDANTISQTASAVVPFSAGQAGWLRATLDVDNGAGQYEVKFWTSTDGSTWTQLGVTRTGTTGPTSIFNSTSQVYIGESLPGKYYRAQIWNGIEGSGGTLAFDADFTTGITSGGQTTFTESSSNAATVTIYRSTSGRKSVAVVRPTWLFGSDDYMQIQNVPDINPTATDSFTVFAAYRRFGTQSVIRPILSKAPSSGAGAGWDLGVAPDSRIPRGYIRDGVSSPSAAGPVFTDGQFVTQCMTVDRDSQLLTVYTNAVAGTPTSISSVRSLANTQVMRIGTYPDGNFFTDMEFFGSAIFRRALTAAEVTTLDDYYVNGGSVAAAEALLATAVFWIDPAKSDAQAAIVRSTSGRKSVAVVRPTLVFGTDDYLEIADNDLLDFGASDSFTVMAVGRFWGNQGTNDTLIAKKADATEITQGWSLSNGSTTALNGQAQIGDGTAGVTATSASRFAGALTTIAAVRNVTTDTVTVYTNGVAGTPVTDSTTGTLANSEVVRIGRLSGAGTEYADMELFAVAIWRRALSGDEVAAVSTALFNAMVTPTSPDDTALVLHTQPGDVAVSQPNTVALHTLRKGLVLE